MCTLVVCPKGANNNASLKTLVQKHGVNLKKFPDRVLNAMGKLAGEVIGDLAGADPLSRKAVESIKSFRAQSIAYGNISEAAFHNARKLPFKWVG